MRAPSALQILEESLNLLREAPAESIAAYLVGAIPFSLALLYFFTEMIRSPFAAERVALESFVVAVLLLWKSVWQAIFMARLHGRLSPRNPERTNSSAGLSRLIAMQCAVQPLRLIAVPASLLVTIPFASVVAFFRNLAFFAALGDPDPIDAARRQAALWTRQNWGMLSVLAVAAVLLFANVLLLLMILPSLARSFLGIEGDLSRLGLGLLNLTTAAVAGSITWLVIDPILSAAYVLRCFYGQSVATGEDLAAALRRATKETAGVMMLILTLLCVAPRLADAQVASEPPKSEQKGPGQTIDPASLDRSIDQTIRHREFTWRSPRAAGEAPPGKWTSWLQSVFQSIGRGAGWLWDRLLDWLRPKAEDPSGRVTSSPKTLIEIWSAVVAVALVASAVAFFFRRRRVAANAVKAPAPAAPAANLADESLTADTLPESSWLKLAEELLERGDYRLALRALYLAGLNHMSGRELISLRRWKTGLDYRRELERRVRINSSMSPELGPAFGRNVSMFERGWYGGRVVDRVAVEDLRAGFEEMRHYARGA